MVPLSLLPLLLPAAAVRGEPELLAGLVPADVALSAPGLSVGAVAALSTTPRARRSLTGIARELCDTTRVAAPTIDGCPTLLSYRGTGLTYVLTPTTTGTCNVYAAPAAAVYAWHQDTVVVANAPTETLTVSAEAGSFENVVITAELAADKLTHVMAQYGRSIIVTNDGATRFTGGTSSTFNIDADGRFDLGTNTIEGAQEQTAIYVEEVCVNTLNIRAKNGAKVKVNVPSGCDGMVMDVEILGCGECDVGSVVEVVSASRVNFKEIQLLETTNTTASDYNGQSFRYTSSFPTYIDHLHLSTMGLNAKVSIEAPLEYINWCLLPGNDTDGYGTANFYGAWTNGKNCTTYDRGRWDLYSTAESSSDIQVTGLTASSRSSGTMCCARPGCSPPVDPEETCASGSRCAAGI